jgi:hypothetical protein
LCYALFVDSVGKNRFVTFLALIISLSVATALADDLPTNLLLKCEGKVWVIIDFEGSRPDSHETKFEMMLRLKDGELSDTGSIGLTTKGCVLRNTTIRCSAKRVEPSTIDRGSSRSELNAFISRETGEYNLFMEVRYFTSANASGKQKGNMKWRRSGICRTVSKPIF